MYQNNAPLANNAAYPQYQQPDSIYYNPNQHQMVPGNQIVPGNMMAGGQPMPGVIVQMNQPNPCLWESGPYKNELCGCFDDCKTCLMSFCCSCIQYGKNYEQIHGEGCLQQGLIYLALAYFKIPCIVHMGFRKEVRQKFNIPGTDWDDFLITWCCSCCALAQDAREIEWRKQEAARRGIPF